MKIRILITSAFALLTPLAAQANVLSLPDAAELEVQRADGLTSERLAIGAFANGEVPSIWAEGARVREVWQAPDASLTTLQLLAPLRAQLAEDGYDLLFECRDFECGGYDFRFSMDLMPEPEMHVNLGDYRFLAAQRMAGDGPEYLALVVSRSRSTSFYHITSIAPDRAVPLAPAAVSTKSAHDLTPVTDAPVKPSDLVSELVTNGSVVLEDLEFTTGSAQLTADEFPTLAALADYLIATPSARVMLVGHTDAVGGMAGNMDLSRARARAVRKRMVGEFGVPAGQITAEGVGFLAPITSNLSEDGRTRNRRVEAVLTTVE